MGAGQRSQVLVTGGSGFIGRRLVAALLNSGAEVTVAARHQPGGPGVRSVAGDLRDPAVAARALDHRPAHDLKSGLATVWQEFTTPAAPEGEAPSEQS
jgi:UDP-glucose 4-epimerase